MAKDDEGGRSASENGAQRRRRRAAIIVFWIALAVAAVNPPGKVALVATLVATLAAFWVVGLWLNRFWRRYVRDRL